MSTNLLFAIRVDGGNKLGMGHLFKMAILAAEIKKKIKNAKVVFFIQKDKWGIAWLKEKGFDVLILPRQLPRAQEAEWILKHTSKAEQIIGLFDILDVSKSYLQRFKEANWKCVVFENTKNSQGVADITINAIVEGVKGQKISRYGSLVFRGAPFRIFHPDYQYYRKITQKKSPPCILITLGGGEDAGLTSVLVEEILREGFEGKVVVVTGPAQKQNGLRRWKSHARVTILGPQPNLAQWIRCADIVVTAGGGTLYELAYLGVPGVAFAKRKHQIQNIRCFEKAGSVISAGLLERKAARKAAGKIINLLDQKKKIIQMSKNGKRLVDGQGLRRITSLIHQLAKGETITL